MDLSSTRLENSSKLHHSLTRLVHINLFHYQTPTSSAKIQSSRRVLMACCSRAPMNMLLIVFLLFIVNNDLVRVSEAIWITIPKIGTKCVSEEIQNNVVVLADYFVVHEDPANTPSISARVTSPYGNNLHHKENITMGQFSFTTTEAGNYLACFWVDNQNLKTETSLSLDWKIGIAAKDWDSVAKKEHIEGVELDLRRLEGAVQAIHSNILYLKEREAEMRGMSERTNARVAWFSVMSLGVCIVVSVFQLWHLKRYFEKKKLI